MCVWKELLILKIDIAGLHVSFFGSNSSIVESKRIYVMILWQPLYINNKDIMKRPDQKKIMNFKTFAKFFHEFHKHNLYFFSRALLFHQRIKRIFYFSWNLFLPRNCKILFYKKGFVSNTIKYENQSSFLSDTNKVVLIFFWLLV